MELSGTRTFVGFGFGPIQAGLFVLEAFRSGNFRRVVLAEVLPEIVRAVREEGGRFRINIAHSDGIETVTLGPVDIEDPAQGEDRARIEEALLEASEIATAVPSVRFYRNDTPGSIHRILAEGLTRRFGARSSGRGEPVIVYAAENHNHAAEILEEAVLSEVPPESRDRVRGGTRFLNTVIGKMSGTIVDPDRSSLATLTPRDPRAMLVESFNRILVSRVRFEGPARFHRGIEVFEEKDDLLPFEEAKLYGHNAAHALAAYVAARLRLIRMDDLRRVDGAVGFVRGAFLEESGAALIRKWAGVDALFTPAGFRAYVDDLMERMLNPNLGDLVERVGRDPQRKLGWDDRLIGTMRLALAQGVVPRRYALGAAAAVVLLAPDVLARDSRVDSVLDGVWSASSPAPAERANILRLVREGIAALRTWEQSGAPPFAGR